MSKQDKTTSTSKGRQSKRAKRAARAEQARAMVAGFNGDGKKKDWKKVAKLMGVDCCDPKNRACKDCPLADMINN